jgi:hypothetical protein
MYPFPGIVQKQQGVAEEASGVQQQHLANPNGQEIVEAAPANVHQEQLVPNIPQQQYSGNVVATTIRLMIFVLVS